MEKLTPAPNKDIDSGRAKVLKCACGNETYQKDGVCVPCKIFPKGGRKKGKGRLKK